MKPEGVLDDEIVSLDSWEHPMYLFYLQPRYTFKFHPLIL